MKNKNLALRPYLESIEECCRLLDRESLVGLVLRLAGQVEPAKRREYLETLVSLLKSDDSSSANQDTDQSGELLDGIECLHKDVRSRLESIEDGSYWDDPDDEYEDDYYDDMPDTLNEVQRGFLFDYLDEAGHLFEKEEYEKSGVLYSKLFALIDEVSSYGYLPDTGIDLLEARARYARCVYETQPVKKRPMAVLPILYTGTGDPCFEDFPSGAMPVLQDVIDAGFDAPAELDEFLPQWAKLLEKKNFRENRVAELLLECTYMQKGEAGVRRAAAAWGKDQPMGFLFLFEILGEEENWGAVKASAEIALEELPPGEDRFTVASTLVRVGKQLEDPETILTGYRERYFSMPDRINLTNLAVEAGRQNRREQELDATLKFDVEAAPLEEPQRLTCINHLMSGRFHEAFKCEQTGKPVGWSATGTGLVYFCTLHLLSRKNMECRLIDEGLSNYTGTSGFYFSSFLDAPDEETDTHAEVIIGLEKVELSDQEGDKYQAWCRDKAEQRVRRIVSNKYRNAYDRAALVLTALAESYVCRGEEGEAKLMLRNFCRVEFNRFTAFRRSVREAVSRSRLMKGWEGEL